jgi:hypothetical protein
MNRFLSMKRLSLMFFGAFAVLVAGTLTFQVYWLNPGERCEKNGKWYDVQSRTCATPVYIPDITGRPAGVSRAEASAAKNAELVDLEQQVTEERAANAAAVQRGRADLKARQGL